MRGLMNSRPTKPITLTLTGLNSAAALWATTVISFLQFGPYTAAHMVSGVVAPEWEEEMLLVWHNLKALGLNFAIDKGRRIKTGELRLVGESRAV